MFIDKYEQYLDHNLKEYSGPITNAKFDTENVVKKASIALGNMRRRCKNPTKKQASYKGLSIEFTNTQFIYWWIVQNRFFKMDRPSVGRIDHSKGYSFDNIELQSCSDNTKEVNHRAGLGSKPIKVNIYRNNELFAIASSLSEASRLTGVKLNAVFQRVSGRYTTPMNGWSFKKA